MTNGAIEMPTNVFRIDELSFGFSVIKLCEYIYCHLKNQYQCIGPIDYKDLNI